MDTMFAAPNCSSVTMPASAAGQWQRPKPSVSQRVFQQRRRNDFSARDEQILRTRVDEWVDVAGQTQ
jgi:hypothetical protein